MRAKSIHFWKGTKRLKEHFSSLTKQGPPRPLNPAPGAWPLDPAKRKNTVGIENNLRLMRWEERKLEGFWPKESRENPRGKARFSLGIIPRLSPDALHPGWPPSAAGPEAQCRQVFPFSASSSGNLFFLLVKQFPQVRVQGRTVDDRQ